MAYKNFRRASQRSKSFKKSEEEVVNTKHSHTMCYELVGVLIEGDGVA